MRVFNPPSHFTLVRSLALSLFLTHTFLYVPPRSSPPTHATWPSFDATQLLRKLAQTDHTRTPPHAQNSALSVAIASRPPYAQDALPLRSGADDTPPALVLCSGLFLGKSGQTAPLSRPWRFQEMAVTFPPPPLASSHALLGCQQRVSMRKVHGLHEEQADRGKSVWGEG